MQLIRALLVAAMLLPFAAAAAAAMRPLAHYTHQRWSEESDPPRPVAALAQDRRGYLWIASAAGLFRFDGIRFEMISAGVDLVTHGAPSAILIRRNGEVCSRQPPGEAWMCEFSQVVRGRTPTSYGWPDEAPMTHCSMRACGSMNGSRPRYMPRRFVVDGEWSAIL